MLHGQWIKQYIKIKTQIYHAEGMKVFAFGSIKMVKFALIALPITNFFKQPPVDNNCPICWSQQSRGLNLNVKWIYDCICTSNELFVIVLHSISINVWVWVSLVTVFPIIYT